MLLLGEFYSEPTIVRWIIYNLIYTSKYIEQKGKLYNVLLFMDYK